MMAKGIVPYHQLTVDDFRVNDQAHPKDGFYIQPSISPQYHFILKSYNGFIFAAVDQWVIFSGLNKNGTSRKSTFKEMKTHLPYAQAVLDLNETCARKIAAVLPGELPSVRAESSEAAETQLRQKIGAFLDAKYKENETEVDAFAKATDHGANMKKVRTLAAEIRKRLDQTPAATVPFPETAPPAASPSPAK